MDRQTDKTDGGHRVITIARLVSPVELKMKQEAHGAFVETLT